jgi:hypothetical protein
MFKRKRFCRFGDTVLNLETAQMISFFRDRNEIEVLFVNRSAVVTGITKDDFERLVQAIKDGEAKA